MRREAAGDQKKGRKEGNPAALLQTKVWPNCSFRAIFRPQNIFMNAENNAVSNYLSFLKFFLHFWLFPYIFLSSPGCFTLKSWVFWVHSNYVFRSPKKLKISVFSIQVHWENCKLTTKNARKTEENIRLLTALFSAFIKIFCGRKMARKEQFAYFVGGFWSTHLNIFFVDFQNFFINFFLNIFRNFLSFWLYELGYLQYF